MLRQMIRHTHCALLFTLCLCPLTWSFLSLASGHRAYVGVTYFWSRSDSRKQIETLEHGKAAITKRRGSMITSQYPSKERLKQWFGGGCDTANRYNHGLAGMTFPFTSSTAQAQFPKVESTLDRSREKQWKHWPQVIGHPDSTWRRICLRSMVVGYGTTCYEETRRAALAWEFDSGSKGMISLSLDHSPKSSTSSVRSLVTYSKLRFPFQKALYVLNPVSVVYDVVDKQIGDFRYSATAYGTMKGHWLCGEERVCVRFNNVTEAVEVEILSYSKPARSVVGYLVWPFIGKMQRDFFEQELNKLGEIGRCSTQSTSRPE